MDILFYVGTYTGKSKGIYLCKLDSSSGAMSIVDTTGGVENPSFLALHPSKKYLYAACENYGPDGGSVAGFAINRSTGKLTPINQQSSKGAGPCYVSCDPSGKVVVAANYGGGSVVCLPTLSNGKLGPATGFDQHTGSSINKQRQGEPHAHSAYVDPSGKWAVSCDLGTDKIYIYRLDATKGTITPNDPPAMLATPGAGPRHFAFHPNNRFAYAINELNNTVTAYAWDNIKGRLEVIGSASSLPNNFEGENTTAEVQVHPTGRFLLGSNRGLDSIAVFSIDERTGQVKLLSNTPTGGKTPRHFGIGFKGNFIVAAHQNSDVLTAFAFNTNSGALVSLNQKLEIPSPVCVRFIQN